MVEHSIIFTFNLIVIEVCNLEKYIHNIMYFVGIQLVFFVVSYFSI
jgi:hypothetical protein